MMDDTYVFEVGGGSKTTDQIQGIPNAYLALDIESGNGKRIPLCLFGMLY
ncbi:AAA family ATPase [Belliella buryatensis]|nr:AAA family ATPase [Belliella buryatensis]